MDETLSWDMHIDHKCNKVKGNLGVLKDVKNCVPSQSLIMLYRTLVEPYFRYCSTTWGKCGQTLLDKLQTLQNRAARIVRGVKFEEADHNQLLRSLGWLSIRQLINYDISSLMYKVANGIVPEQTQFMFNKCTFIHIIQDQLALGIMLSQK